MPYDLSKEPTFAYVPRFSADRWDDFGIFRETYLAELFDAQAAEAFRDYGILQLIFVRESQVSWPFRSVDSIAHNLQAVMADLRHLQGFLAAVCERTAEDREGDQEQGGEELAKQGDGLCELGNRLSREIGALADEIERHAGAWEFKTR